MLFFIKYMLKQTMRLYIDFEVEVTNLWWSIVILVSSLSSVEFKLHAAEVKIEQDNVCSGIEDTGFGLSMATVTPPSSVSSITSSSTCKNMWC